ncbi:phosphoribosylglycinamide formyltransferase [Neoehrlichia mikurensis]|uniref:Phosphoribosylglycinamide formyltransferase n=1 Tax=Neoehrlichia mikurensis TaxID=89586 RepID=A0A9Q9C0Z5_9RICK|nr:phosphoribosylglycinamide formyltransferase [Neoehrlichia mikurensis]QXK92407.1 phosphoribosylglycinamide formyltransferase [Neoehrlichia mikurensis]QXK94099.1 phosphoribosylglycinamide formyltransferase [Neoehrlichia mikurensis]UTO55989.1 phosphoribosylglycinamide formyltransferase [Neoehrlichia mikurensis]UTO56904.1 phosphoribosylglycinamide formyltransferase [Neoehrlichia mikurensis]
MQKIRLGILISGRGSNMQSIINACNSDFPAAVSCVISNNSNAQGLKIAQEANIDTFIVRKRPLDINKIEEILIKYKVDLVCLAGFMSIINDSFLKNWHLKVINIHPSLLPSFKGLNAQKQAFDAGVKIAGCTVHYVYPEVDSGPIIIQAAVPVFATDNVESLSTKILKMEHLCYPEAIRLIALNKIQIINNKVTSTEKLFFMDNN